jgi:hypothetical protein
MIIIKQTEEIIIKRMMMMMMIITELMKNMAKILIIMEEKIKYNIIKMNITNKL